MIKETTSSTNTTENQFVLQRAMEGTTWAINHTLYHLGSTDPQICRRMKRAICALQEPRLWTHLLNYFAVRRWDRCHDYRYFFGGEVAERIDLAIIELFTIDECAGDNGKVVQLRQSIEAQDLKLRQAGAYLLGLRGDKVAIPTLAEIIASGDERWQFRAVQALMVINDEACARPLILALSRDRDRLHRDARRALQSLGEKALGVWLEALDHPDGHIRWHAARGLAEMGDGRAAAVLAEGLFVEEYVVQWSTANALAQLGEQAIPGVLTALSHHKLNESARKATIQTLQENKSKIIQSTLKPLLNALLAHAAGEKVQRLAHEMLADWELEK